MGLTLLSAGVTVTALVTWAFPANTFISAYALAGVHGWQRISTWGFAGWLLTAGTVFLSAGLRSKAEGGMSVLARLAIFCGDASYAIYLTSNFTMDRLVRLVEHIHPPAAPNSILVQATTLLTVVLVVLVGMAFHLLVERPLTSWLQHRIHSRPYSTSRLPEPIPINVRSPRERGSVEL